MSVNPFDIRTVLVAKHAQHAVLIHFPIALFSAAVAFIEESEDLSAQKSNFTFIPTLTGHRTTDDRPVQRLGRKRRRCEV
jgi:hypothetical protein